MPINAVSRPIEILLIEDNPGDVRLTKEALRMAKTPNHIRVAEDGIQALEMLFRQGEYARDPLPDLILLDLNLPRKDGRDLLKEIKADPTLRRIPVIVFTTSRAELDIAWAYDMQANCYIVKPMDFQQFMKVARAIEEFWLNTARLPLEKETRRTVLGIPVE
ncbi:MAG: response regulator [Anaerolineae bacterium]